MAVPNDKLMNFFEVNILYLQLADLETEHSPSHKISLSFYVASEIFSLKYNRIRYNKEHLKNKYRRELENGQLGRIRIKTLPKKLSV